MNLHTYLEVTGILFHVIVGGILALSAFFYWCTRESRAAQKKSQQDLELAVQEMEDEKLRDSGMSQLGILRTHE